MWHSSGRALRAEREPPSPKRYHARMARRPNREDPLTEVRRLLREMRRRPGTRDDAMRGAIEIALFRLPPRQESIVRRYDLGGERACEIQRDLALSARQFFRDRHAGLTLLSRFVFEPASARNAVAANAAGAEPYDTKLAARTHARELAQRADRRSLDLLAELAMTASDAAERADVLVELAETAVEFSEESVAAQAVREAATLIGGLDAVQTGDVLAGRLALVRAHLTDSFDGALSLVAQSVTALRADLARSGDRQSAAALADALGDGARLYYYLGSYAQARAASHEAVAFIDSFGLRKSAKMLEILAMHAAIEASVSGRTRAAAGNVASLLRVAFDSGWSATACRLGSTLVGLNAICGEYGEAIGWYHRLLPLSERGARPSDRANLRMEAAHAYTMTGKPREALALLGYARSSDGCPSKQMPSWHAVAGAALASSGDDAAALTEARTALAAYGSLGMSRGMGDAHRLLAVCSAHRGDTRRAREHIGEARRLVERYGVPYALLLTLVSEAAIVRTPVARSNAIEYERLLHRLART
jgi:hypothetical protein